MTQQLDLSGTWRVTWSDGMHGAISKPFAEIQDPDRYMDVPVPMELHQALQEKGLIEDPNLGMNTLKARWVEEQYWQYRTTFTAPAEALNRPAWLVFEQLDIQATIALNGETVGTHVNAHRPCRVNVTGKLREGENTLVVTLESGLFYVAERSGTDYHPGVEDYMLVKRSWLRKAQNQFGWDWNARMINVGITGPVRLEWGEKVRLDQVVVWSELSASHAKAALTVRAFVEGLDARKPVKAHLRARVRETGQEVRVPITVEPGLGCYEAKLTLKNPELWWPVGHGAQSLYTVDVTVEAGKDVKEEATKRIGIRKVEIDRTPHPEAGEYFIIKVNGRRIFCKGGNWVPADLVLSSVTRDRVDELVRLAVKANFNILRLWGGGVYAGHDLLEACDEAGLLVWHDMLFACAKYPGEDPGFLAEVSAEILWAVREFANHPSLAVWCGNNELEWGTWDWKFDAFGKSLPDYAIYHHIIPRALRQEDPHGRPYWPSSPFSPDHIHPNDPTVGDQHPWGVTLADHGTDFWHYRAYIDRFPNEGGVLGASTPATLRQFLPEGQRTIRSFAWEHHDNAMEYLTQKPGVAYQELDFWLGRSYKEMDLDEYAFASGLLQAEGLMEYIDNYRRRMFSSSSAIFWMYNDSWPTTHGWTIIDYYRRKKPSYHPVRRAFQPVTVVVADNGNEITVYGVNDSPAEWAGTLRYGLFAMGGGRPIDQTAQVVLQPISQWR